jgi:poly-beta-1,6-N-acetyl-D-glucosamine synthase
MEITFWFLVFVIIYHYVLFPAFVFILATIAKKPIEKGILFPVVSLVIAAYNEEKVIEEKIRNSFDLDYPKDKLEIIVVSDGSTDETPQVAANYKNKGVISLFDPPRRGKTAALNRAVSRARGEVVIFSDANSMYDPQAIKLIVRNFYDSSVGGVCGRKTIIENVERESSRGDSLFWSFESKMKIQQSLTGSITTGDGEIFAMRKELYKAIPDQVINDDTAITFNIVQRGYRVVYEPEAVSNEEASIVWKDDFNVKARMVCGGYQTLSLFSKMLFPPINYFAIQFLSHKALRWFMPFLLIALYIVNLFLMSGFYLYFIILQSGFYAIALFGLIGKKLPGTPKFFYFPAYFCSMNAAAAKGFVYFLKGKAGVDVWKKAQRYRANGADDLNYHDRP